MATLYELTGNYLSVYNNPELDQEVIDDTLESLSDDIGDKVENYIKVIKNLEADAEIFKKAEGEFKAKRQAVEKKITTMKDSLSKSLKAMEIKNVETTLFKVKFAKNPKRVEISDMAEIPFQYYVPQPPTVDKKAIKKALEEGQEVEGATLVQDERLTF